VAPFYLRKFSYLPFSLSLSTFFPLKSTERIFKTFVLMLDDKFWARLWVNLSFREDVTFYWVGEGTSEG